MPVRALIFDVDGTLAETEEIHRAAFNEAFAEAGLTWIWTVEDYARLLKVTGGRERIAAYVAEIGREPEHFPAKWTPVCVDKMRPGKELEPHSDPIGVEKALVDIPALHRRKTALYNDHIRGGDIALRAGVERLMRTARQQGALLAIATTTSRPNVISLIAATLGESAVAWFASIRTGEDVARKKPDPEVFMLVLADLAIAPADCLVFEDSANGLKAALAAGIPTIITPSMYTADEDFSGATLLLRDLDEFGEPWTGAAAN